jgi:hypothetical protein
MTERWVSNFRRGVQLELNTPGQCFLCGTRYGISGADNACNASTCLACGTRQCHPGLRAECHVCYVGLLAGTTYRSCGYAKCGQRAVAHAPRVGFACAGHLQRAKIDLSVIPERLAKEFFAIDDAGYKFRTERTE